MGHGLNGVNCYMFSGGKNVAPLGGFGTYHEWQAVITSDGRKRDHFKAMKNFGGLVRTFGPQISSAVKQWDTVIGFYCPYYTTEFLSGPQIGAMEWKKHQEFYDGLARLMQLAHINTKFIDLEKIPLKELQVHPSLWVFSMDFMDKETQQKLADYVRNGGKLIVNPSLPDKDINQEKCTVLADYLGTSPSKGMRSPLFYQDNHDYFSSDQTTVFSKPAEGEVVATMADGSVCGLRVKRNAGEALLLGMGLGHSFDYQIDLVKDYAARMGVQPAIEIERDLQAVLRKGDKYGFLFLANFHDESKSTKIRMALPGEASKTSFPSKGSLEMGPRQCFVIPLNVSFSETEKIRYSTVEIVEIKKEKKGTTFILRGVPGTEAELELVTKRKSASLSGKKIKAKNTKGKLKLTLTMKSELEELVIK
jgi:beta-galactosidase